MSDIIKPHIYESINILSQSWATGKKNLEKVIFSIKIQKLLYWL